MGVLATVPSLPAREGCKQELQRLSTLGENVCRLCLVWVEDLGNGGYSDNPVVQWVIDTFER